MTTTWSSQLLKIANEAKDASLGFSYELPNIVFAHLLRQLFEHNVDLVLELETEDHEGWSLDQAYYDLVVLRAGESSLCIPLPLLIPQVVATVVKRATCVELGVHDRPLDTGTEESHEKITALWAEVFELVSMNDIELARGILQDGYNLQVPEGAKEEVELVVVVGRRLRRRRANPALIASILDGAKSEAQE